MRKGLRKFFYMTKGERALGLAYAAVMVAAAGIGLVAVARSGNGEALAGATFGFLLWICAAGAIGGWLGLFAARAWMGDTGKVGLARAVVGGLAATFIAALVGGTLIHPVIGTFYAPVVVLSSFLAQPLLAVAWATVLIGAHYLMLVIKDERDFGFGRGAEHRAISQLSSLSQAQLFPRK